MKKILVAGAFLGTGLLFGWEPTLPDTFPSGAKVPSLDETYPNFIVRDGDTARLERVFAKGLRGEPLVVAVLGGSITSGAKAGTYERQWGYVLADWFRHTFPRSSVEYVNAGIGATGSAFACFRVEADVCARRPDVVGVEFAVNDPDSESSTEYNEGVVRHLLGAPSCPFVFQLSMVHKSVGNRQARHVPVSAHYDIPHFSFRDAFRPLFASGRLKHVDVAKDELHPDEIGHPYMAALVCRYLNEKLAAFQAAKRPPRAVRPLPESPLVGRTFDRGRVWRTGDLKILENSGFGPFRDPKNSKWKDGLRAAKPGDRLVFEVDAPTCGILYFRVNGPMGRARVTVDGAAPQVLDGWFGQTWGGYTPYALLWRDHPGRHVVAIEVLEEKMPASTGHAFELDAVLTAGESEAVQAPIGVFDSGVGGLTVLEKMLSMDRYDNRTGMPGADGVPDFAGERFQYFGDQANMPYGDYDGFGKSDYLRQLVVADAAFLLGDRYWTSADAPLATGLKSRAKTLVIACNTATAYGLDAVQAFAATNAGTTAIGVIGAGVRATLEELGLATNAAPVSIGVLATPGTIASGAYARTIREQLKAQGIATPVHVYSQGCPGLADAVEAGTPEAREIARVNLLKLLEQHRAAATGAPLKAVILGCTHFPFVLDALQKAAPGVTFVDPALATADACYRDLRDRGLLAHGVHRLDAFLSVANPALETKHLTPGKALTRATKYGRSCGDATLWTKQVPYTRAEAARNDFVRNRLPATWALLPAVPRNVPELLTTEKGEKVADRTTWEKTRRPEIRAFFEKYVYGRRPVERPPRLSFSLAEPDKVMMDGAALRKRVRVEYGGAYGTGSFVFTAFIPRTCSKPAPSFVLICNRNPQLNIDPERVNRTGFWPAEELVARGFAAIAFYNGDITPDSEHGRTLGAYTCFEADVHRTYRRLDNWGVLSAWAWGASRVLDWIETEPTLDAKHVAVIGHSRGGKTALLAGALDDRFGMTCSNDSGCGGAKLNHIDLPQAEFYWHMMRTRRFWFCNNIAEWIGHDSEMPYDQHELAALVAPRLLCIGSATQDRWAGPRGEYWTGRLASPAWELYGQKGLVSTDFPLPEHPQQEGSISYHVRTGEHNLTPYDWGVYMDFAKSKGW